MSENTLIRVFVARCLLSVGKKYFTGEISFNHPTEDILLERLSSSWKIGRGFRGNGGTYKWTH
jgi:hypothetical protein